MNDVSRSAVDSGCDNGKSDCLLADRAPHALRDTSLGLSESAVGAQSQRSGVWYPTLVQLDESELATVLALVPGGAENLQGIYPLSPLQEGMLLHRLLNERTDTYILSALLQLDARSQVDRLRDALQKVVERHEALRSAVLWEKLSRPVQVVCAQVCVPVATITLDAGRDAVDQMKERMQPFGQMFDLRQAPLIRLQVAADPSSPRWYAVLHVHHVVCDHQSLRLILSEAIACLQGREDELPAPVPFRVHLEQTLDTMDVKDAEAFFRRKLGDVDEPTAPFGLTDVYGDGSEIEEVHRMLDPALAARIRSGAKRCGVSAARLFHAAWALVVANTSGRDDVVFGTVLASRQRSMHAHAHRMLGLCVNTLPLRLSLHGLTVTELLASTHRELVQLLGHESVPLTLAQGCSLVAGSAPLFTSLLNYRHSAPELDVAAATGVKVLARGEAWTNYPVTMTVDDLADGFLLMAKADRRVGAERVIEYLRTTLCSLLAAMENGPDTLALTLTVLPESERHKVIEQFNATQAPWPATKLIHQLFEEQVEKTPHCIAVTLGPQSLTYERLNQRANQLARYLRGRGVGPDERVVICLSRSVDMLVAMLGTLKAGGAYVPADPANPPERLRHILEDASPRVLLTQLIQLSVLPNLATEVIALDRDWPAIAELRAENLDVGSLQLRPEHLAYVIYTSGSTGKPKGVMVEHRNIVNYAVYAMRRLDVASGSGSLICTSFSFDLMLTGLYPTLFCGRTVHLCREAQGMPALLDEVLRLHDIAPLKLTPSHLSLLDDALVKGELAGRVRLLVLGGEPLRPAAVKLWREHAPRTRILNHYGPTETTVGSVIYEVEGAVPDPVPIGRPIANTRVYILNRHLQPVPLGVSGELFIGGAGVARGYLNRPELTAECFLRDPFSADPHSRIYRTGDLARWQADGTIEYLGRNDDQVKVRGYRIEPGEIAARLHEAADVKQAVVIARQDGRGDTCLVAYVVLRDARGSLDVPALRAHLKQALPEYMVPAAFVAIESFPLTQNGKLDRGALPAPDLAAGASRNYEVPQDETEELVARIWQALLGVERVGRHDNFLELGGHSLAAMQSAARIQATLGVEIPLRAVFDSTLKELAESLDQLRRASLLARIARGGDEMEQLLNEVASMPDGCVRQLLAQRTLEGRP